MTEVVGFCQEDLDEDDVMLLDTWEEVSTDSPSFSPDGSWLNWLEPSFTVKPRAICLLSHLQILHEAWSEEQLYGQRFSPGYKTREWRGNAAPVSERR